MYLKISITSIYLLFLSLSSWGQIYTSEQQQGPFVIDAETDNWPKLTLAEDSSYAYAFSHEGSRLFVSLQVFDLKLQNHILLTGMTLWFDEKGKKRQQKGIHYPTGYKQQDIVRDPLRFREVLEAVQLQKREISEKLVSLELLNFTGKGSRVWGKAINPNTMQLSLGFDEAGTLIYEGSIPLELVFTNPDVYAPGNSKGFSVGWETGELGRPELRGDDAVGLSGSNPANPRKFHSDSDRRFQRELNLYRTYAVPEKIWIKRLLLKK